MPREIVNMAAIVDFVEKRLQAAGGNLPTATSKKVAVNLASTVISEAASQVAAEAAAEAASMAIAEVASQVTAEAAALGGGAN